MAGERLVPLLVVPPVSQGGLLKKALIAISVKAETDIKVYKEEGVDKEVDLQ